VADLMWVSIDIYWRQSKNASDELKKPAGWRA